MTMLGTCFLSELGKAKESAGKLNFVKRDIHSLPKAWRLYLVRSGFLEAGDFDGAELLWQNVLLRFSPKAKWRQICCRQWNFLTCPDRLAYMRTNLLGIFSLEALDSFQNGIGRMQVRALDLLNLTDVRAVEVDRSELVTVLAEAMIIPSYALQTYITWEEVNPYTLCGTIHYAGMKTSGIFYFNEHFQPVRFETYDRYYTAKDGTFQRLKWTAEANCFSKDGRFGFPTRFTASWHLPGKSYQYFTADLTSVQLYLKN